MAWPPPGSTTSRSRSRPRPWRRRGARCWMAEAPGVQDKMHLTLERKIQIGFGIAVAIIVAVGAAALRSTTATVESALWVAHTLEVRRQLGATFADLITVETAVRGYVITGDTTYLGPYHAAQATVSGVLSGRRRAEQIVQETQARFQQMLASSTAVLYGNTVVGETYSPSWVSKNITRITGYELDEPLRPTWWIDHLHADDRARVLAEMPVLLVHDRLTTEYRFQYKDGTYHWVHDESRVLRDAAGEPVEVVGSWVDITDRRRAAAAP